ncbi:DUF1593 domain-containing protein [Aurantibacter crassamenti]|uniref:DUF1593 domain-containing protein n=1 Tax=Aurantibacter crassamenti TaxID=1837375 RepID=UPI00193A6CC1|nr:DUF1593 domain-containing protein [Aurantibacter crassamenti]MBM1106475.1 DUF1593 domain-containing protein [Aurantibacter crassamenti]
MKYQIVLVFLAICFSSSNFYGQSELPRIIVSTDIGGDDPDDFQSMVHLLIYADKFDIQGLISSPPSIGRKKDILEAIDAYEKDFEALQKHSKNYVAPEILRNRTKQGALDPQTHEIPQEVSEGAKYIIEKAMENETSPLWILVWGSITDVAQAVHQNPDIKKRIRVYSIGSWNTRQDPKARDYLYKNHDDLWWIENDHTFRGMYQGGYQDDTYGNISFVSTAIKNHGALGNLFYQKKKDIKMGDTPSVLYFLSGDINDPSDSSWGGSFIKNSHGSNYWVDNPVDSLKTGNHIGAKTVSKHRKLFLDDWKKRMLSLTDNP